MGKVSRISMLGQLVLALGVFISMNLHADDACKTAVDQMKASMENLKKYKITAYEMDANALKATSAGAQTATGTSADSDPSIANFNQAQEFLKASQVANQACINEFKENFEPAANAALKACTRNEQIKEAYNKIATQVATTCAGDIPPAGGLDQANQSGAQNTAARDANGGGKGLPDWLLPAALGAGIGALAAGMMGKKDDDKKDDKKPASSGSGGESPSAPEVPEAPGPDPVTDADDGGDDGDDEDDSNDDNGGEDNAESPLPPPGDVEYGEDGSGSGGDDSEGTTVATNFDASLCIDDTSGDVDPLCEAETLSAFSRRDGSEDDSTDETDIDGDGGSGSTTDGGSGSTGDFEGGRDGGDDSSSTGGDTGDDDLDGTRGLSAQGGHSGSGGAAEGNLYLSDSVRAGAIPEGAGTNRNALPKTNQQNNTQAAQGRGVASSPANGAKSTTINPSSPEHPCNKNPNGRECLELQNQAINENIIQRYRDMGIYLDNPNDKK